MEYALLWFLFGVVCSAIATSRNRSGCGWFLLGCIFGPFALVVAALPSLKPVVAPAPYHDPDECVRCPDCRELVRWDARKCKHCGTELTPWEKRPES